MTRPARRVRPWQVALVLLVLVLVLVGLVALANRPPAVTLELVASGFEEPTAMIETNGHFIVAERGGTVRTLEGDTVLDLSAEVATGYWEQGLLGIAERDGELFVHYTDREGDTVVATGSRVLLTVDQPDVMHNGGQLTFGPDGLLYLGLGDGGPGNDPDGRGQSRDDLLGSIVRLDPDTGEAEPLAFGLRNPWRFAFAPNGDMYIADVAQGGPEEINILPAGESGLNFGWSIREGTRCFDAETCENDGLVDPIVEYTRGLGECAAVVGGYIYRGPIDDLAGRYLYADFCSGKLWALGIGQLLDTEHLFTSFAEDANGDVYLLTYAGEVFRLVAG